MKVEEVRKFLVAALGALGLGATFAVQYGTDLIPAQWMVVIQSLLAVLTAFGVYQVPNVPAEFPKGIAPRHAKPEG